MRKILVLGALFVLCSSVEAQKTQIKRNVPKFDAREMVMHRTNEMVQSLSLNNTQRLAVLKLNEEFVPKMMPDQEGMRKPDGQRIRNNRAMDPQREKMSPNPGRPKMGMKPPRMDKKGCGQQVPKMEPPKGDPRDMPHHGDMDKVLKMYNMRLKVILKPEQYKKYMEGEAMHGPHGGQQIPPPVRYN